MSRDILKEHFSRQESVELNPRNEFKEELMRSLICRINKQEKRQRFYRLLLWIVVAVLSILLISWCLPFVKVCLPTIDISPIFTVLVTTLFAIIFVYSYFINRMELRELRRQLGLLK